MSWLTVAQTSIRSASVLTNSYVGSTTVNCANLNQLTFLTSFTLGSLTSMSWKVQFSADGSTWFDQEIDDTANEAISGNEAQIPARSFVRVFSQSCTLAITVPVKAPFARVAVQGIGTVTSSSCSIISLYGVG